jgi:hypothetical protein
VSSSSLFEGSGAGGFCVDVSALAGLCLKCITVIIADAKITVTITAPTIISKLFMVENKFRFAPLSDESAPFIVKFFSAVPIFPKSSMT